MRHYVIDDMTDTLAETFPTREEAETYAAEMGVEYRAAVPVEEITADDPDYLTAADVPAQTIEEVAEDYGVTSGDVTAMLWGHPDNTATTPAERAAVEARRRHRNREVDR